MSRKAYKYFEEAIDAANKFSSLIEEGLLGSTVQNRQSALLMQIKALLGKGTYFATVGRLKESLPFFDRAETVVHDLEEDSQYEFKFDLYNCLGNAYGTNGEWVQAVELGFDQQLCVAKDHLDDDHVARAQYNLAKACYQMADYTLARSTILNCIDTIKVRCVDQTQFAEAEALLKRIFEACERVNEVDRLPGLLQNASDMESKFDYMYQMSKILYRLDRTKEAFEMAKKLPPVMEQVRFSQTIKRKVYRLMGELSSELRQWADAMFYNRKWLELIDEEDGEELVDCLLLLLKAHTQSKEIDVGDPITLASKCYDLIKTEGDRSQKELEALSYLSMLNELAGHHQEASRFREECFGLALAIQAEKETAAGKDYEGVEESSYFGDRKVSKTTKSLMGGDFQMRTRTKKVGVIAKRRVRATRPNPDKPAAKKRKKVAAKIEESDLSEASDLDDFIASDSSAEGKENFAPASKKNNSAVLISSDVEESFATMSISHSQQHQQFDDDLNDWGPTTYFDESTAYKPVALRINVQVERRTLVIPCFDDDITERKKISWLVQETCKRYAEIDEKEPIIEALSPLNSNALLSPNDPVGLVLHDGQTIQARVVGWRKRAWLQEYNYQVGRLAIPSNPDISDIFKETSLEGGSFDFSLMELTDTDLTGLFAALKAKAHDYKDGLQLNFSCCSCSNTLAMNLSSISSHIHSLDLSFTSLDTDCLVEFLNAPLPLLQILNLSFMINATEEVISALGRLGLDSSLRSISLGGWTGVNIEPLHFFPSLKTINLEASIAGSLVGFLTKSNSVEELTVQIDGLEDACWLVEGLSKNYSVTHLDLLSSPPEVVDFLRLRLDSRIRVTQL